jgi:hypothetical protein
MRRLLRVVVWILVLTLVVTVPAAATKPVEVSGKWTNSAYDGLLQCKQHVVSVVVTAPMWHEWDDGGFRGRSESDWRIVGHGTPESPADCTSKPNSVYALLHATGTFAGDLCLGTWDGDVCQGEKHTGSFDFRLQWQVTDPCPAPCDEDTMSGKLVILKGYDGLAGLHGVLECWGRTGPKAVGGRVSYAGQVHFDPQP